MEMWGGYVGMMRLFLVWGVILTVFENPVLGRPLLGPAITLVSMWRRKKVYIYILWILKVKGANQKIVNLIKSVFLAPNICFCIFFLSNKPYFGNGLLRDLDTGIFIPCNYLVRYIKYNCKRFKYLSESTVQKSLFI